VLCLRFGVCPNHSAGETSQEKAQGKRTTLCKGSGQEVTTKTRRGFAAMDPEQRREIAQLGGQAAHASGHAHEFTREEARRAGKMGGWVTSRDHKHMARIGRKGANVKHQNRAEKGKQ
jgi:general stress protein YciG